MIILGFDTATPATAVGLLGPGAIARERFDGPDDRGRPRHTTRLLELARELLVEAGLDWSDVHRIAVGLGPGTFTGLRIGVSTARALGQATGASFVGVSTLRVLAAAASGAAGATGAGAAAGPTGAGAATGAADAPTASESPAILAALDARRGEAYVATFVDGQLLEGPHALTPESLVALARTPPPGGRATWLCVGDGAIRFREHLRSAELTIPPDDSPLHRVNARVLCELAAGEPEQEPQALVPDYVRRPDAEIGPRETR